MTINSPLMKMLILSLSVIISGCQTAKLVKDTAATTKEHYAGPGIEETNWQEESETHHNLLNYPKPRGKILVSAYGFKDQSGQYKPSPSSTFSTAVSQGANAILIKALKDSGWFTPIEREGLQNLLTERKIIRATLRGTNKEMPPLLGASILLEGGIIGYDTNIKTGGAGAKYFGVGAHEQYRVDQVTVSLRAIDISSGKIINTVVVSKSIFSKEFHAGFFRFIKFKRLLEMEAGYTRNEPVQLALVDAVETAVIRLITNGLHERLWSLANPADFNHPLVQQYSDKAAIAPQTTPTQMAKTTPSTQTVVSVPAPKAIVKPTTKPKAKPMQAVETKPAVTVPAPKPIMPTAAKQASTTQPQKKVVKVIPKPPAKPVKPAVILNDQTNQPLETVYAVSSKYKPKGEFYAIQLMSSTDANDIINFLANTSADRNKFIYISYFLNGKEKFALLYGSFTDKSNADSAINNLPKELKVHKPWVRLVASHS